MPSPALLGTPFQLSCPGSLSSGQGRRPHAAAARHWVSASPPWRPLLGAPPRVSKASGVPGRPPMAARSHCGSPKPPLVTLRPEGPLWLRSVGVLRSRRRSRGASAVLHNTREPSIVTAASIIPWCRPLCWPRPTWLPRRVRRRRRRGGMAHCLTGVVVHSSRASRSWRTNELQFPESCQKRVTMTAEVREREACWEMEFVGGVVRRQMSRWGVAIKMQITEFKRATQFLGSV